MVRVRGLVFNAFEVFVIQSEDCQTDNGMRAAIWLETSGDNNLPYARISSARAFVQAQLEGRTEQFATALTWVTPMPVTLTQDATWNRLTAELNRAGQAVATVVGRLDFDDEPRLVRDADGSLHMEYGFGHLSGYSRRLVIARVEDVTAGGK
jgi:hypothetical protein